MTYIFNMAWAAILPFLFIANCFGMDDLTKAGVYAVDRSYCNLSVPQEWISNAIGRAVVQYDITPSQAILAAAERGTAIARELAQSGRLNEYCEGRRMK